MRDRRCQLMQVGGDLCVVEQDRGDADHHEHSASQTPSTVQGTDLI
jgi:hypothetical protein